MVNKVSNTNEILDHNSAELYARIHNSNNWCIYLWGGEGTAEQLEQYSEAAHTVGGVRTQHDLQWSS